MPGKAAIWNVGQLADFELRDRRAELDRKLGQLPPGNPGADVVRDALQEIIGEQESRTVSRRTDRAAAAQRATAAAPSSYRCP
jgi:hypothetical protein